MTLQADNYNPDSAALVVGPPGDAASADALTFDTNTDIWPAGINTSQTTQDAIDELATTLYAGDRVIGGDDVIFGDMTPAAMVLLQTTLSTWTLLGTAPKRGASFTTPTLNVRASNTLRPGWFLAQVAADSAEVVLLTRALADPAGSPTNTYLELEFSQDSNITAGGGVTTLYFSESDTGDIDPENACFVTIGRTADSTWVAIFTIIEATVTAYTHTTTWTNNAVCPFSKIGIEKEGTTYRGYAVAHDGQSAKQLGQSTSTLAADRWAVAMSASGGPNPMLGLKSLFRKASATY